MVRRMNPYLSAANPDKNYSAAAFWFWNGRLEPEKLRKQIDMMEEQGVYQMFMHARAYLETPYFSDEWWQAIEASVERAKEKGVYAWMYDEYAWPSGVAGCVFDGCPHQAPSRVLAKGPQNANKSIELRSDVPDGCQVLYTYKKEEGKERYLVKFYNKDAIDYLNKDTIRDFIEITHEEYKKHCGDEFGKIIPGIFYDEIFTTSHPLPWTDSFAERFLERFGYDLLPAAESLFGGEEEMDQKVRADYYTMVAELYEEAFFAQIGDWCEENKLDLTGHIEEGFASHPMRQGHYFNTTRHMGIPGADCHDYRYRLPRIITRHEPKWSVSVARAYGKKYSMSEAMGGAGWGCSLQEFKRGINVLGAMGISFFILHGFYYSTEAQGAQADWPTSFFYQNPYWPYFRGFADYMRRVQYMNSIGRAEVRVGLFYPIEQLYKYSINGGCFGKGNLLADFFEESLNVLTDNQIDVDFIDKTSLVRAEIREGKICVGTQEFRALLLPAELEADDELSDVLDHAEKGGIQLIYVKTAKSVCEKEGAVYAEKLPEEVEKRIRIDVKVLEGEKYEFVVNHRITEHGEHFMLANGTDRPRKYKLLLDAHGSMVALSPETGKTRAVASCDTEEGTYVDIALEADEAVYLLFNSGLEIEEKPSYTKGNYRLMLGRWDFLPVEYEDRFAGMREMEVPIARFMAEGQSPRHIRIKNTKEEDGRIGRHVSAWKAAWVARREGWKANSERKDMFFRKWLELPSVPEKARVCISAINEAELYVNGIKAGRFVSNGQPGTFEIASYLNAGRNLIAVHVHNETPASDEWAQVREIPKGRLTSLLLEGDIVCGGKKIPLETDESWISAVVLHDGWQSPEKEFDARVEDAGRAVCFWAYDEGNIESWIHVFERGRLPLLPEGDLPLFGKTVSWPVNCAYTVNVPVGCVKVYEPKVSGLIGFSLDGMPVKFENGVLELKNDSMTHAITVFVRAENAEDGLKENLSIEVAPIRTFLGDWAKLGLDWYSGLARYENWIRIEKQEGKRYILSLTDVSQIAEVYVNGKPAGVRLWAPYELDITELIESGDNTVSVIVGNSAASERRHMSVDEGQASGWNRYWNEENIDREPRNKVSGLLNEVRIYTV